MATITTTNPPRSDLDALIENLLDEADTPAPRAADAAATRSAARDVAPASQPRPYWAD